MIEDLFVQFDLIYKHTHTRTPTTAGVAVTVHSPYRVCDHNHQSSLIDDSKFYAILCEVVGEFCVQFDHSYLYLSRLSDITNCRTPCVLCIAQNTKDINRQMCTEIHLSQTQFPREQGTVPA